MRSVRYIRDDLNHEGRKVYDVLKQCIPEIECPNGCNLCCDNSVAIIHGDCGEYDEIDNKIGSQLCHNIVDGKCLVYENRPFICRIFYKREDSGECKRGLLVDNPLTVEQARRLMWCFENGTEQDARAVVANIL